MNKEEETPSLRGIVDLLSFAIPVAPFVDPFTDGNEVPQIEPDKGSIWDTLLVAIKAQVKKDGIRPESIQPGQIESDVYEEAVSYIFHDVTEFYAWWFNPDDDRFFTVQQQNKVNIPPALREVVKPVVDDNLDAMREVGEIPAGQDTDGLDDTITDALSRYIFNWQNWFYARKEEDDIDSYFETASFYDEIYNQSDYGDLSNIVDPEQYDEYSDVPYIAEP